MNAVTPPKRSVSSRRTLAKSSFAKRAPPLSTTGRKNSTRNTGGLRLIGHVIVELRGRLERHEAHLPARVVPVRRLDDQRVIEVPAQRSPRHLESQPIP